MEKVKVRRPAVSGQFYPASPKELENQVASFIDKAQEKLEALACMLPHAGYMYSGAVAGATLSRVNIKDRIILLGPNHTGTGEEFSIVTQGAWQTPLGEVKVDDELAVELLKGSRYLKDDNSAHLYEHSLEVELPFLQYLKKDFQIVPIAFMSEDPRILKEIGREIATVIQKLGIKKETLIIASSDMTHYEPKAQAKKKDSEAIAAILELDEDKLLAKISQMDISMCGWAPVTVMLSAVKILGAQKAQLIKYQTSGDITGDDDSVVGYAGVVII